MRHGGPVSWIVVAVLLAGCGGAREDGPTITVFAAASLAAPFEALAREFERRNPGERVALHLAGTPTLVLQIREGAPADLLASADEENMARLREAGRVAGDAVVFARNAMTIVTPQGNPRGIAGLRDLERKDLAVLLCGPEVPAGRYARRLLEHGGITVASRSDEPSVRAVVTKVELGEADAGLVYRTDARAARDRVGEVEIPAEENVEARYPLAVLRGPREEAARRFADFVVSEAGRAVLADAGFLSP
ncbi:MAG: molybdate ABC transporter substrate-binding protein [Planctomycetota bacterium]